MGLLDIYNQTLITLSANPTIFMYYQGSEAVAEHLCLDNLAFSKIREGYMGIPAQNVYAIHPNGLHLIESLPEDYKERPYEYFLKLKKDARDAEANFKELINKVNTSTIQTAKWTKYLFIATFVIAVGTAALAIYPLVQQSDSTQELQQLRDRLQRLEDRSLPNNPPNHSAPSANPQTLTLDSSKSPSKRK